MKDAFIPETFAIYEFVIYADIVETLFKDTFDAFIFEKLLEADTLIPL
jgi:hypothetical protein